MQMEEQQDSLIERIAYKIYRHGLTIPAVMMLEMHKPLAGVGSALIQFFAPGLEWVLGEEDTEELAMLLSDRDQVEYLITRIEGLDINSGKEVKNEC
jgi:hypothetical protein